MNNHRFLKRPQPHHDDDGRPVKRPRYWKHQGPRPNYQQNQNFSSGRHEPSYRSWPNPRRGSFHSHQTPTARPFHQTPHQQQFFQRHNSYPQNRGAPSMYNNQQQQQWNASFPPSNQFPWHNQTHQPPVTREADYNPSDSSASSSPSYASTSKSDAFPGYFTTAISQPNPSPPNSSPSGSTEYEPVFSTTIAAKNRPQSVLPIKPDVVQSKKNKVVDVLGILDPKLIQIVRYLSSFQREIQESCDGKEKEETREDVPVPKESKTQKDVSDKSASKINIKNIDADGQECIRLLYQNKICSSCEGVFRDVSTHECVEEKSYGEWYPSTVDWINDRAICNEITKD